MCCRFLSRRNAPDTQARLKSFCAMVNQFTHQVPSKYVPGKMVYTFVPGKQIAFTDASWVHSGMVDRRMWGKGKRKVDARARGARIALLDAVFPHNHGDKTCRVSFNTRTRKKKGRKWFGNVTGELTRNHVDLIFKAFGESHGTVICDNASVYKEFEEKLSDMTEDELYQWILEHDPEPNVFQVMHDTGPAKDCKWLMDHVRKQKLRTELLQKIAAEKGHAVWFLPPYHPECHRCCLHVRVEVELWVK